jgi:hypothetical protein
MYIADEVRKQKGTTHPLVGLLGLSFAPSGELHYQFAVMAHVPDSQHYLIQMYEWMLGEPGNLQLVSLQWFIDQHVKFYSNELEWRSAAEEEQRKSAAIRQQQTEKKD